VELFTDAGTGTKVVRAGDDAERSDEEERRRWKA
jgi:acetylglutamate kinase